MAIYSVQAAGNASALREGHLRNATQLLYECEFKASIDEVDEFIRQVPSDLKDSDDHRNIVFAFVVRAAALRFLGKIEEAENTLKSVHAVSTEKSIIFFQEWFSDVKEKTEYCRKN